jgi:transcriptional regulator with XRE-family HTH domain
MKPLSDQLRDAIEKADVSRYELAKATGVSQSTLSKFVLKQRPGLSFDSMDRIGQYLGLVIVKKPTKNKGANRGNARQ